MLKSVQRAGSESQLYYFLAVLLETALLTLTYKTEVVHPKLHSKKGLCSWDSSITLTTPILDQLSSLTSTLGVPWTSANPHRGSKQMTTNLIPFTLLTIFRAQRSCKATNKWAQATSLKTVIPFLSSPGNILFPAQGGCPQIAPTLAELRLMSVRQFHLLVRKLSNVTAYKQGRK